jgi:hypothetical protein
MNALGNSRQQNLCGYLKCFYVMLASLVCSKCYQSHNVAVTLPLKLPNIKRYQAL